MRERHNYPNSRRYPFSGKLICGECGSPFVRFTQYSASGPRYRWQCSKHRQDKDLCSMKRVLEENVQNAFVTMVKKLQFAPFILDAYCEEVISSERREHEERLSEIAAGLKQNTEARHRLALLLQSGCVEPVSYNQELIKLENAAAKIKDERNQLTEVKDNPVAEFQRFVHHFRGESFPEEGFTEHVEKVVIETPTRFRFVLKCGLEFTEEIENVTTSASDHSEPMNAAAAEAQVPTEADRPGEDTQEAIAS